MSRRVLFCEGPDDLAALREVLTRHFSAEKWQGISQNRNERWVIRGNVVELIIAQSKAQVLSKAVALIESDSPADPVATVGLSFDPNGHDDPQSRQWFEQGLRSLALRLAGAAYEATPAGRAPLAIVPLPWKSTEAPHYELADSHCLERVAIDALAAVYPADHARVARWIAELRSERPSPAPNWKTAARLWNAILVADVSEHSFYSRVFGQSQPVRATIFEQLGRSRFLAALETLVA